MCWAHSQVSKQQQETDAVSFLWWPVAPVISVWSCPGPWCPSMSHSPKNEWGLQETQGLSPWGFSLVTWRDRCPLPLTHHPQGGVCPQGGQVVPLSPSKQGIRRGPTDVVNFLSLAFYWPFHLRRQISSVQSAEARGTPPPWAVRL